jgi:hypothetical protein
MGLYNKLSQGKISSKSLLDFIQKNILCLYGSMPYIKYNREKDDKRQFDDFDFKTLFTL